MLDESNFILIGQLTKTRGLKGELKVYSLTDFPDQFFELNTVYLKKDGSIIPHQIIDAISHGTNIFLKFEGYTDLEASQMLIGSEIYIPRNQRMELPSDSYYFDEIEGFEVESSSGEFIGRLVDINHYPASDVLVIDNNGKLTEIPFVRELIPEVDSKNRKITVIDMPSLWEE